MILLFPKVYQLKFSVVIPLYNKAPYIKRAIDSVLNQTYQEFEIIVIDDGSTDGGGDIVAEFTDPRIRLIRQENAGVSAARNRGIEEALAEFIALLDADDEWSYEHLETLSSLIRFYPNCGAYATSFNYSNIGNHNLQKKHINYPIGWKGIINTESYLKYSIKQPIFYTSSICITKQILNTIGYFKEGINHGEDWTMWLRILNTSTICFINKTTVTYHTDAKNRLCKDVTDLEIYDYPFMFLEKIINNCNSNLKELLINFANARITGRAAIFLYQGKYDLFKKCVSLIYPSKQFSFKILIFRFLAHLPKPIFISFKEIYYPFRKPQ